MEYSFKNSKHNDQKRANKNNRLSDSIVDYEDVALEYFKDSDGKLRCALSGEILQGDNLSKEHIIALAIGGHDIAANIVPTAHGYNTIKWDMYVLKYLELQKNQEGEKIYSPYRLLKIVNYMLKSINARGTGIDEYRDIILTPNDIDEYLRDIETNNKQAIYPEKIAPKNGEARTIERNNQDIQYEVEGITIYTFISDAIKKLEDEGIIPDEYIKQLESILKNTKETAVFRKLDTEAEIRQEIIKAIRDRNIGNEYDIAYVFQKRVRSKEEAEKKIDAALKHISEILKQNGIDKEWSSIVLENKPLVLIDNNEVENVKKTIEFLANESELDINLFERCFNYNENARKYITIFQKLKNKGIDISEFRTRDKSLKDFLEMRGIKFEALGVEDFNIGNIINLLRAGNIKTTAEEKGQLIKLGVMNDTHVKKQRGEVERIRQFTADYYIQIFKELSEKGVNFMGNQNNSLKLLCKEQGIKFEGMKVADFNIAEIISRFRQGTVRTTEEEREELLKLGIISREHIKKLTGEIRRIEHKNANYYILMFNELKEKGIALTQFKRSTKSLKVFCEEQGIRFEEIGMEDFSVGDVIDGFRQGRIRTTEKEREELLKLGIISREHIKKLNGEIDKIESKIANGYVQLFIKLEEKGIKVSELTSKTKSLQTFLRDHGMKIENFWGEDFNIGKVIEGLRNGRIRTNDEEKVKLIELGIISELNIKKQSGEVERIRQKTADYYINIFSKLHEIGIDLSKVSTTNQSLQKFLETCGMKIEDVGVEDFNLGKTINNLRSGAVITTELQRERLVELAILNEDHVKKLRNEVKRVEHKKSAYYVDIFVSLQKKGFALSQFKRNTKSLRAFCEKQGIKFGEIGIQDFNVGGIINKLRTGHIATTYKERKVLFDLGILNEEHINKLGEKDNEKAKNIMKKSVANQVKSNIETRADMYQQSRGNQHSNYLSIGG